jgi:uncharacterized protein (TIGR03437 family)
MRLALLILTAAAAMAQTGEFLLGGLLPAEPNCIFTVADFNLDNRLDVAVANRASWDFFVYLQSPDGELVLEEQSWEVLSLEPADMLAGDFNNDGKPDIAFSFTGAPEAGIWLGTGRGWFTTYHPTPLDITPMRMKAADFDRDGNLDVAVLSARAVHILSGDGEGFLDAARTALTLKEAEGAFGGVDAGDIDADGDLDLVMVSDLGPEAAGPPKLFVARNQGRGGFSVSESVGTGDSCCVSPLDVELADVTGDGRPEALTRKHVWRNSGTGSFTVQSVPVVSSTILNVTAADLNFDGLADWVAAGVPGSHLGLSTGQGFYTLGPYYLDASGFGVIAATDLNGDRKTDLLMREATGLRILENNLPYIPVSTKQQIHFAPLPDAGLAASPVSLTATATSGLAVIFASVTPAFCEVVRKTLVRLDQPGVCRILARQPGDARFDPAVSVLRSFNVSLSSQGISFGPLGDLVLGAAPFRVVAAASSGLPVSFTAGPPNVCGVAGNLLTILDSGQCSVTALQSGNEVFAAAVPVTRTFSVRGGPLVSSITNAASYAPMLSPNSLGVLLGARLGPVPVVTLHDASGATHVMEPSFAGGSQINFLVPARTALGNATMRLATASGTAEFPITIAATSPGLFTIGGTGRGLAAAQALIVKSDKSVTALSVADGPIPLAGDEEIFLVLYGTGIRGHGPQVTAMIAGQPAEVVYAGPQGSSPGLDQVNLRLPQPSGIPGSVEIRLTVDGIAANPVTVAFR